MINPVSNAASSQPVAQPIAAKALLQESLETPAQTAREANAGDRQAIRRQARHAAAKSSGK